MVFGTSTAVSIAISWRRGLRARTCAVVAAGLLGGCAELTSIYHSRPIDPTPRIITTDAYQRSVFVVPDGEVPPNTPKMWRLCAEPTPDAFAALSASLAAKGDVKAQQAELGAAIAQSGATFERTQTVNLLRESMYRTCERYLSGALNKEQFIVQAARDQRAMTAVLAIEQLTRTARPPAIILAPAGTAASVGGETGAELVKDFADEKTNAKEALDAADGAYKAALATGKCEAVTTAPAGDEGTDPTLTAWTTCNTARATRAARQADHKAASDRLDKVIEVARNSRPITAGTTSGTPSDGEGGEKLSSAALIEVAKAVEKIAVAPAIDEVLMFCIAYLSTRDKKDEDTVKGCIDILKQRAKLDENRLENFFAGIASSDGSEVSTGPYQPFKQKLLALINGSSEAEIGSRMTTFEADAGIRSRLAARCTSVAACRQALNDIGYASIWSRDGKKLEGAAASWSRGVGR